MKKHLIALAVAGAVAAPAMAQNVTLYGNIVAGFTNTDTAGSDNVTSAGGSSVSGSTGADRRGTGVFGLKGSEDLGGGLKAGFVLEQSLNGANGKLNTTGSSFYFDRKAYVEVSGSFGTIQHGVVYTADEDLEGYSGMGWNIFDADTSESSGGKLGSTTKYTSPTIAGFQAKVSNSLSEGTAGAQQASYGVSYTNGNLYVAMAASEQMNAAANDSTVVYAVGYKLGAADIRASTHRLDIAGVNSDYTRFGVTYPLGNGMSATGHYGKYNAAANTSFKTMGVGIDKALSKRTTLFAAYYNKDFTGTGSDVTINAVGIEHKF
jgi:predicted porin